MFYIFVILCFSLCLCTASDDESLEEDYSIEVYQIDAVPSEEQILDMRGGINNLWGNKNLSICPDHLLRPRKIGFMGYQKEKQYIERELCGIVSPHSEIFRRHMKVDSVVSRIPIHPLTKELACTDHWSSEQLGSNFSEQRKEEWYEIKKSLVWAIGRQEFETIYGIVSYAFEQIKAGWNAFAERNKDNPQHKDKILENEQAKKKNIRFLSDVLACHDGRATRNIRFIEDIIVHDDLKDIFFFSMDFEEMLEGIKRLNLQPQRLQLHQNYKDSLLPDERSLWTQDDLCIWCDSSVVIRKIENLSGLCWVARSGATGEPHSLLSPTRMECIDLEKDKKDSVEFKLNPVNHAKHHKKKQEGEGKHRFLTLLGVTCDEVQSRCSRNVGVSESYVDVFVEHGGFLNVELENGFVGYLEDHSKSSLTHSPQLPLEGSFGPGIYVSSRGIARFKSTSHIRRPHWPSLPQVDVQWMFDSDHPSAEVIQDRATASLNPHPVLSLSPEERKEHIRRFYNTYKTEIHEGLDPDDPVHPYYRTLAWLAKTKILDKDTSVSWMMEDLLNTAGHWGWAKDKVASASETAIFTSSAATHFVAVFPYASPYREPKMTTQGPWTHVAMLPNRHSPTASLLQHIKQNTDGLLRRFQVRDDALRRYWSQHNGESDIFSFAYGYYCDRQHTQKLPLEVKNLILSFLPQKWSLHEENGLVISSYQDGLRYAWGQHCGLGGAMDLVMSAFVKVGDQDSKSWVSTGRLNPRLSGLPTITKQAIYRMIRQHGVEHVRKAYNLWWQRMGV